MTLLCHMVTISVSFFLPQHVCLRQTSTPATSVSSANYCLTPSNYPLPSLSLPVSPNSTVFSTTNTPFQDSEIKCLIRISMNKYLKSRLSVFAGNGPRNLKKRTLYIPATCPDVLESNISRMIQPIDCNLCPTLFFFSLFFTLFFTLLFGGHCCCEVLHLWQAVKPAG